eukprot:1195051-Prorocentrum_minimum.AAC.4
MMQSDQTPVLLPFSDVAPGAPPPGGFPSSAAGFPIICTSLRAQSGALTHNLRRWFRKRAAAPGTAHDQNKTCLTGIVELTTDNARGGSDRVTPVRMLPPHPSAK